MREVGDGESRALSEATWVARRFGLHSVSISWWAAVCVLCVCVRMGGGGQFAVSTSRRQHKNGGLCHLNLHQKRSESLSSHGMASNR